MNKWPVPARWIAGLGVILALAIVWVLLLPHLVNMEWLRGRVEAEFSKRLNGTVEIQSLDIGVLPRPRLILNESRITLPGKADIRARSVTAYPRIIPLLRGRLRMESVHFEAPFVSAVIPRREEPGEGFYLSDLLGRLKSFLDTLAKRAPGLTLEWDGGTVRLDGAGKTGILLEAVQGRIDLPPRTLLVHLSAASASGEAIDLKGSMDPRDLAMKGRLRLDRFEPGAWAEVFDHPIPKMARNTLIDVDADFRSQGAADFHATIHNLMLESPRLPGTLSVTEGRVEFDGEILSLRNWRTVLPALLRTWVLGCWESWRER